MVINYIFLAKKEKPSGHAYRINYAKFLKDIFPEIDAKGFAVIINQEQYNLQYFAYCNARTGVCNLSISANYKPAIAANVLTVIDSMIRKNEKRASYNIIVAFDEISKYYCDKAFPLLNQLERKIRELVYIILIKTYGLDWFRKTTTEEMRAKIKNTSRGKNDNALIESALLEMTIQDLKAYLFDPYTTERFEQLILSGVLTEENIASKSKEELVNLITECIKRESLWNRCFKGMLGIAAFDTELGEIREYRNKIDHGKELHVDEYRAFRRISRGLLEKIENAINIVQKSEFTQSDKINSAVAFDFAIKSSFMDTIMKQWSEAVKDIRTNSIINTQYFEAVKNSQKDSSNVRLWQLSEAIKNAQSGSASVQLKEVIKNMQSFSANTWKLSESIKYTQSGPAEVQIRQLSEAIKDFQTSSAFVLLQQLAEAVRSSQSSTTANENFNRLSEIIRSEKGRPEMATTDDGQTKSDDDANDT